METTRATSCLLSRLYNHIEKKGLHLKERICSQREQILSCKRRQHVTRETKPFDIDDVTLPIPTPSPLPPTPPPPPTTLECVFIPLKIVKIVIIRFGVKLYPVLWCRTLCLLHILLFRPMDEQHASDLTLHLKPW